MDLLPDYGDLGSGCEDEDCGLAAGLPQDCSDQAWPWEEPIFGLIELVCVTVIYIPLMLLGLVGNVLTILVVCLRPHMRSSTYLYLSSMAVSDLFILLLLPLDLYKLWRPRPWPLGDLACKLTMFLSECCTFCTILHITFLSVERYLAVCWPITAKTLVTRRRTRALIGCLWLGAALSAAPVLLMVGVEEVGGEEQGGAITGGRERGSGHLTLMDGGLEGTKWGQEENERWMDRVGEFGEGVERKLGIGETQERKPGDGGRRERDRTQAEKDEGEVKMDVEGQWHDRVIDEAGGRAGDVDGGQTDSRECRCTHYAVSSGLLAAMMILSNLYFLVPLCILGLVYGLIGRTLWLRPQSSRRDQSHRHTIKMLGVIVLAFVLCWLPFHVGRTIFSLSQDTGTESQQVYADADAHPEIGTLSNGTDQRAVIAAKDTYPEADGMSCDVCEETKVNTDTRPALHSHTSFHTSTGTLKTVRDHRTLPTADPYAGSPVHPHNHTAHDHTPSNSTYTGPDTNLYFLYYLSQYFNLASSVLFYLSAAVNPLLYNLMSARYRHAVHSLLRTPSQSQSGRLRTLTMRHSTTTL